jgi:F420-dependent oxidoreductase-like protein
MMAGSPTRRLQFGVQLVAQRTTWAEYMDAVRAVEEMGYDSVWNADHLLPFNGADDGACFETASTLAVMAAATSRIRVGSLVYGVLYRDPATLVKSATTVDVISRGRLNVALGSAWAEREFRAYGLPFPPVVERLARLDETVQIVKQMWTQPRTTFTGRYYQLHDAPCEPRPVQQPHPPIMIGGNGRTTLRITAKHADLWNANRLSPAACAERIAILHDACRDAGRNPDEVELTVHLPMAIARSHEVAESSARATAAVNGEDLDDVREEWLLGTPDEVRAQVQRYRDVGITQWILATDTPYDLPALRLFADDVVAAFR